MTFLRRLLGVSARCKNNSSPHSLTAHRSKISCDCGTSSPDAALLRDFAGCGARSVTLSLCKCISATNCARPGSHSPNGIGAGPALANARARAICKNALRQACT